MIQIKKLQSNQLSDIKKFIYDQGLNSNNIVGTFDNIFVCIDNDSLCGFISGIIKDNNLFINQLYIVPNERGKYLATSLIKAILNSADFKGVTNAYIYGEYEVFYIKVGFKEINCLDEDIIDYNYIRTVYGQTFKIKLYYINIKEYFNKLCCK